MTKFYLYKTSENINDDDKYIAMVYATSCKLESGDCRVLVGTETIAYIKNVDRVDVE